LSLSSPKNPLFTTRRKPISMTLIGAFVLAAFPRKDDPPMKKLES
jgi:hypothetical protein